MHRIIENETRPNTCHRDVTVPMGFNEKGNIKEFTLSYDVASGSEITPCDKIDKPLMVYRFTGNVMTSIATLCT